MPKSLDDLLDDTIESLQAIKRLIEEGHEAKAMAALTHIILRLDNER